ncbi:MAG: hypothetical protein IAF02_12035 [Anaerolineae bacterium]|nr:hypothetical protein [Anaerolineae bacterium]
MKLAKVGLSGCVIWLILLCLLGSCLVPIGLAVGGVTAGANADFVADTLGPIMCPPETKGQVYTYATTATDENGFEYATTAYETHCMNQAGELVTNLGSTAGFAWAGILAGGGLLLALLLATLLAMPVIALVSRYLKRTPPE